MVAYLADIIDIPDVYAQSRCSVSVSHVLVPVTFEEKIRQNPDGTFWPGDAFYIIFTARGSSTCLSFNVGNIESNEYLKVYSPGNNKWEDDTSYNRFKDLRDSNCNNKPPKYKCKSALVEIDSDLAPHRCLRDVFDDVSFNGTKYNECLDTMPIPEISLTVKGKGSYRDGDNRIRYHYPQDTETVHPRVRVPYGNITFYYPVLYDIDGFPAKNLDGTYYRNDVIGIHAVPDSIYKRERYGIISFDTDIISSPLSVIDHTTCTSTCNVTLSGMLMSPYSDTIHNGDLLSAHYTPTRLGITDIIHYSRMYNIDRYIGEYYSIAKPLLVRYNPQITYTETWTRLKDAGLQSFDNRYAIGIRYDGSMGGGPDDPDIVHPDRPVKITEILSAYLITNGSGKINTIWRPDANMTLAQGLADLSVHDSVYDYIPEYYTFVDTFPNPANVYWNDTVRDTMIESAGYGKILRDIDFIPEQIAKLNTNITTVDNLVSQDYGGNTITYIHTSTYQYPFGYLSIPFNITAYYIDDTYEPQQDTAVSIMSVNITEDIGSRTFLNIVEYYLDKHTSDEFAYMHMSDVYEMNPIQYLDGHTHVLYINKTGIQYDLGLYNTAVSDNLIITRPEFDILEPLTDLDIMNSTSGEFLLSPSWYDIRITAARDDNIQTNTLKMGGAEISDVIYYQLNMSPDNHLYVNKANDVAIIPYTVYFGDMTEIHVDGTRYTSSTCNYTGCVVLLSSTRPADFVVYNMWGGVSTATDVTGIVLEYSDRAWLEHTPMRLLWILVTLGIFYILYRTLKKLWNP